VTTEDDDEPPVSGTAAATATVPRPQLTASPDVASAGDATGILGSGFPPGQKIMLSWSPGLGTATTVTSKAGGFSVAMVIFPNDIVGPRTLIAGTAAVPRLAIEAFLVQPGTAEPPFTSAGLPGA
jgi:hypothetical protein